MYHPRLAGDHYEMGFKYGALLDSKGVPMRDVIRLSDRQVEFGEASLGIAEDALPDVMREVRGLADGLKIDYGRVASWLLSTYCVGDVHGCSCFAVSAGGEVYFGRNSDMFPEFRETSESVLYRPAGKNVFVGHSTSMILLEDGLNEHGLAAGMTFMMPRSVKPGLNAGFLIRAVLEECGTTSEAIDFIRAAPISSCQNIVLADRGGDLAVVECSANRVEVMRSRSSVIATNQFNSDAMIGEHANPEKNWHRSEERFTTIRRSLDVRDFDLDAAKEVLRGNKGFMCQYGRAENFDTLWSVVYRLSDLHNEIAEGNPSRKRFKEDGRLAWGIGKER